MSTESRTSQDEIKLWDLPSVDDENIEDDADKTNALNRPVNRWKFEPPEEEEQDVEPLTAEQIEEIRSAAHQEGFDAGREEGLTKGIEEGREQGFAQGSEEAKEQGLQQGLEQAKSQIDTQMQDFERMLNGLSAPLHQVNNEVKKELALLAVALAKNIVNKEVSTSPDVAIKAIEDGIKALPINDADVVIEVNPEQLADITEYFGQEHIEKSRWKLVGNEQLAFGGCKIATSNNAVDMSIERRCEQVFNQVLLAQGIKNDPRAD